MISMIGPDMCNCQNEPTWRDLLRCAAPSLLFFSMMNSVCFAINDVGGPLITFNDNGASSWFEDERAIVDANAGTAGRIILSSVGNAGGTGGASRNGDVEVASYELATTGLDHYTLADSPEADDHDSAALLKLPDSRYLSNLFQTLGR
jgi:hypothetical protein